MAKFNAQGIEGLSLSLEEFSEIPDSVVVDMLMAGGEVIKKAHEAAIKRTFKRHSGHLADSPSIHLKAGGKSNGFQRYVLVYPQGAHHTYRAKSRTYVPYRWGRVGESKRTKGGEKTATNADVGFVQEFGGHGNEPTMWMREANEKAADACADAELAVYDQWAKSKGL